MSDRLRRSTRQTKASSNVAAEPPGAKRKTQDPEQWLRCLFQNPKSVLTTIDISDLFNAGAWNMLSDESRAELKKLLPPTAFVGYKPSLDKNHPAGQENMDMDCDGLSPEVDASSLFTDSHFLAAARTLQDHIYSNWLSTSHQEKVATFEKKLRDGTLAVPWKDEQWLDDNSPQPITAALCRTAHWKTLAGGAAQVKLATLVQHGIIQIGDILAYRRNFSTLNLTIEKDAIVESIDPSTHAVAVLTAVGTGGALPESLLVPNPAAPDPTILRSVRSVTNVSSPSMLECRLLDIDGRVDKCQRPNGNAWKSMTVWRWRTQNEGGAMGGRCGRESHGTLFYLRGNFYHEEFRE